jgi:RNA polymerase sigma factor (TIGR02999 family)
VIECGDGVLPRIALCGVGGYRFLDFTTAELSMETPRDEVTLLLNDAGRGDQEALARLMRLVYAELRKIAAGYLRRERKCHTLQPTALVNETYLRLIGQQSAEWGSRKHFYRVAAQVMRRILVDHARARRASKRAGRTVLLVDDAELTASARDVEILALDEALERLAVADPRLARVVELRFFGGLTVPETAEVLGLSVATVTREWTAARALLRRTLVAGGAP